MKNKWIVYGFLVFLIAITSTLLYVNACLESKERIVTQNKITKLENRVDNLQQALQTKDKELEAGLRNTQNGLMLKIDYLEKQIGEGE